MVTMTNPETGVKEKLQAGFDQLPDPPGDGKTGCQSRRFDADQVDQAWKARRTLFPDDKIPGRLARSLKLRPDALMSG
jgi:hypothetical protein